MPAVLKVRTNCWDHRVGPACEQLGIQHEPIPEDAPDIPLTALYFSLDGVLRSDNIEMDREVPTMESKVNLALYEQRNGYTHLSPETLVVETIPIEELGATVEERQLAVMDRGRFQLLSPQVRARISKDERWVLKRDGASSAWAVWMVEDPDETDRIMREAIAHPFEDATGFVNEECHFVLQKHIDRPVTLNDHKCHLRAISVHMDGRSYVYDKLHCYQALAKFSSNGFGNRDAHITNATRECQ